MVGLWIGWMVCSINDKVIGIWIDEDMCWCCSCIWENFWKLYCFKLLVIIVVEYVKFDIVVDVFDYVLVVC